MADRLQAYADWLVANQDKRGTPEYETVANAYKQMRQQPVDRSFTSAFQQGLDAPLENMATTARMLGAEGTADTLSGLTTAPENYESAANRFINPQQGDFTVGGFALVICLELLLSKLANLPVHSLPELAVQHWDLLLAQKAQL